MKEHKLLDGIKAELELKNDAALARLLKVQPSVISKLRSKRLPVTAETILRVHDMVGWEISKIRGYMA